MFRQNMEENLRRIKFDDSTKISDRAIRDITKWLWTFEETVEVRNVEDDPEYQSIDVDLIWTTKKRKFKIEIKADRWHKTGNFFFETHSNKEKNTKGCFLYTEANLILYYFIQPKILYSLPMPATRDWFLANFNNFREKETTTPVNGTFYTTVGSLVPIQQVLDKVSGVKKVQLLSSAKSYP